MTNGTITPNPSDISSSQLPLFPEDTASWDDRIVNQLMYIPFGYDSSKLFKQSKLKKIFLLDKSSWGQMVPSGQDIFLRDSCPVNTCQITFDAKYKTEADAIIFKVCYNTIYISINIATRSIFADTAPNKLKKCLIFRCFDHYFKPKHVKPQNQIWILYILESPLHTPSFRGLNDVINWTASYRHDSDLVTPYEKFVYYNSKFKVHSKSVNYAQGKTKKVAWFVSNCSARNKRLQYARMLAKYIQVDIYGRCGSLKCSLNTAEKCFDKLDREYKFYLSFENSNCRDYITEKFYSNGLKHNVVPITMGAHPEDYKRSAPANSYIHVDNFLSPRDLAQYLDQLDANDTLFNQYLNWKGSGEFINTYFWCRLCAMLHAPIKPKSYDDLANWWYASSICTSDQWL
uniref:Fucosyltransferase n=1 Tax=Tetranychus urticae TaxID=32264 RepID=T1KST4_TETUR